jgi:hypothetical protein
MRRSRAYLIVREIVRTIFAFVVMGAFFSLMIFIENIEF